MVWGNGLASFFLYMVVFLTFVSVLLNYAIIIRNLNKPGNTFCKPRNEAILYWIHTHITVLKALCILIYFSDESMRHCIRAETQRKIFKILHRSGIHFDRLLLCRDI